MMRCVRRCVCKGFPMCIKRSSFLRTAHVGQPWDGSGAIAVMCDLMVVWWGCGDGIKAYVSGLPLAHAWGGAGRGGSPGVQWNGGVVPGNAGEACGLFARGLCRAGQ